MESEWVLAALRETVLAVPLAPRQVTGGSSSGNSSLQPSGHGRVGPGSRSEARGLL